MDLISQKIWFKTDKIMSENKGNVTIHGIILGTTKAVS